MRILYIPKLVVTFYPVKYGLLYNWYAATDARKITSSDNWVVPTTTQRSTLNTYLGGSIIAGGKLKETGIVYWDSPNSTATNSSGFNGRGGGIRINGFSGLRSNGTYICSNQLDATRMQGFQLLASSAINTNKADLKSYGWSLRFLYVGTGTPTEYVGNDGKKYHAILIGSQY